MQLRLIRCTESAGTCKVVFQVIKARRPMKKGSFAYKVFVSKAKASIDVKNGVCRPDQHAQFMISFDVRSKIGNEPVGLSNHQLVVQHKNQTLTPMRLASKS